MPPSTSIHGLRPLAVQSFLSSLIFCTWESMKLWPPKPGLTDMMSTRSTSARTYSMAERGVPGFRATPARQPRLFTKFTVRWRCVVAALSQCTVMMSAPALAKSSTRCSASTIIRWQSKRAFGSLFRSDSTTSGPMVMLGTKRPSITSTCTQSAPAPMTSSTSFPKLAKSAERIDGAICNVFSHVRSLLTRGFVESGASAMPRAGMPEAWRNEFLPKQN
mmetsp:Transcript_20675/g.45362  ORF Transcript_20675/g.45362 Transcript_20675/m.45362 type:complete len:219 (+) Transcript_20675:214-870(+)